MTSRTVKLARKLILEIIQLPRHKYAKALVAFFAAYSRSATYTRLTHTNTHTHHANAYTHRDSDAHVYPCMYPYACNTGSLSTGDRR